MGIVFLNTKEYGPSSGEGKSQQNERPKLTDRNLTRSAILSNSQAIQNQKVTSIDSSKRMYITPKNCHLEAFLHFSNEICVAIGFCALAMSCV